MLIGALYDPMFTRMAQAPAAIKISSINQQVRFTYGLLNIPDPSGIGRKNQRISCLYFNRLATIRREGAAPSNKVTELLLHDLPAPAAWRTLPDTRLDAIVTLLAERCNHGDWFPERHSHRSGCGQNLLAGILEMGDVH
jgi:hypothetical protein